MSDLPRGLHKAPFTVEAPEKASQTLLAHLDSCPYSASLYLRHKGGQQGPALARGEAFHSFAERATGMLLENDEIEMPPDVGKELMQAILEERVDLAVPTSEQEACRLMAWNWCAGTVINPETVAGIEQMFELQVGDWIVRGKLDLLLRGDGWMTVRDYKTSLKVQAQEEYEQSFQPQMYALLALEGVPEDGATPLGRGLQEVSAQEVYPRFRMGESKIPDYDPTPGEMVTRSAIYDRAHLADFKRTIESLLSKLDHGLATGEWGAQESTHCRICPAAGECPLPAREVRSIGTPDDCREVLSRIVATERQLKEDKEAAKGFIGENGELVVGDEVWGFTLERRETANKDAITAALSGAGKDPDEFYKTSLSTRFGKKKAKKVSA